MGVIDNIKSRIKTVYGLNPSAFLWNWSTPSPLAKKNQIEQYQRYVYTVVSAIAEDVGKVEFVVERQNKRTGEWVSYPNHPFHKLIRRPNPDASQFQLIELHQTYMELAGESFWYLIKGQRTDKPRQVMLLRPDMVDVVVDKPENNPLGLVTGYVLTKPDGTKIPFERNEVLHFKTPNPINPYRGMGVVEAASTYIQTEEFASRWTRNSIFNSGRPSGVLNIKGIVDNDEFKQLRKRFRQEYSGTDNAGKTMILKGAEGIDYQKLGMELGEVALKELKDMTRDDIMIMWRVSKTMLGITDDVNRANAREARAVWLENVIKPKMERIVDVLDSQLIDIWGEEYRLSYEDPAPKSIKDRIEEWNAGVDKWMTKNEIRQERNELFGTNLPDLPDGDIIWQPLSLVPMEKNKPNPQEEAPPVKAKELTREEKGELFRQELFARQEVWEKKYRQAVNRVFDSQKQEILQNQKAVSKVFEDWVFDKQKSKQLFNQLLVPITQELMKEQAKVALEVAGDDETEFEINQKVRNYISDRIDRFSDSTDTETTDKIKESIAEGVQLGESIAQLRKRIEAIYADAVGIRSERIARSETIAASNEAALEAYRQSPLVAGQEWSAEIDACEFCQAMNGKVIGLSSAFARVGEIVDGSAGGTFIVDYLDITHPPLHPNCKCSILPVSSAQLSLSRLPDMIKEYDEMDKRTREAKQLLEEIQAEKEKLEAEKEEFEKELTELEEVLNV